MKLKDCKDGFYTDGNKVYELENKVDVIIWTKTSEDTYETDACVENIYTFKDIEVIPFSYKQIGTDTLWV